MRRGHRPAAWGSRTSARHVNVLLLVQELPAEPGGVRTLVLGVADLLAEPHDVCVAVVSATPRRVMPDDLDPRVLARLDGRSKPGGGWTAIRPRLSRLERILVAPLSLLRWPVVRRFAYGRLAQAPVGLFASVAARAVERSLPGEGRWKPDVIHVFTADVTGHVARSLGRRLGRPVVVSGAVHPGQYGDGPIDSALYRGAAAVVAISDAEAAVYRRLGVEDDRLEVIPPASRDLGTDGREAARARLGIDGRVVLFAGARRPYKGADLLLAAAPEVAAAVGPVSFVFAGPGPSVGAWPAESDARIVDCGTVSDEEMADWTRAADVTVMPSQFEACSIVVLEAWSAAVPAVVSDIDTLRRQVERSGGGLAVPRDPHSIAAALVELLRDDEQRSELGRNGRCFWERNCSEPVRMTAYLSLYRSVVEDAGTGTRQR